MPNGRLHKKLWKRAFGNCGYPFVPVNKQTDEYSQKLPGTRHRLKDHDPLRTGDYEDPLPELDKWRIVYRLFHIAIDCWWTGMSKELRRKWKEKIENGRYPIVIDGYFWQIIECIVKDPLAVYKLLPWECESLPLNWVEYIEMKKQTEGKILERIH